jgi:hypothetical protein
MSSLTADLRLRILPLAAAQGIGLACGIGGVWLCSHWVAPEDYGRYGIFVTLAPLGASVVFAARVKWISRYWPDSQARPAIWRRSVGSVLPLLLALAFASAAAAAVFAPDQLAAYGIVLFLSATLLSFLQLVQSALQAERSHWRDCGVALAASSTRSFAPPLLYASNGSLSSLLLGFLLHALASATVAATQTRGWWRIAAGAPRTAEPPAYHAPTFVLLAAAGWVLLGANRWIVGGWFGAEAAGFFTLAAAVGAVPAATLGGVLLQYFQPQWFAREGPPQLAREVDAVVLSYVLLGVAAAAALQAMLPWLVAEGLIGARYAAAQSWLLPAGCAAVATFAGNFYHALLLAVRLERFCMRVDLAGMAVLIGGSVAAATVGPDWLRTWLTVSPLVPLLVNRTLARRAIAGARPAA